MQWYKYMEVGSRLKNPELPIWVVCAESHFTVLFAQASIMERTCLGRKPLLHVHQRMRRLSDLLVLWNGFKAPRISKSRRVINSINAYTITRGSLLQDSRPLHKMLPFDLVYYDELANQDQPITLTQVAILHVSAYYILRVAGRVPRIQLQTMSRVHGAQEFSGRIASIVRQCCINSQTDVEF
eukprot:1156155-Pelagomonas_calceolata.AAC.2